MSDKEIEKGCPEGAGDEISMLDLVATLWRRKWFILGFTIVAAALSIVYAITLPNKYAASSTLLPISGSASSTLSQYAGLATLAGVSLPAASASDPTTKIQTILQSRTFAEKLILDMNLTAVILPKDKKGKSNNLLADATRELQDNILSATFDSKTSIIKISAKTKTPQISRDIANRAVDLLQEDLKARTLSSSGKNMVLLEQQVDDQEKKVRIAQNNLTTYQKRNKLVSPQAQSTGGFQFYQNLIQQKVTLEIELSRLESALSADNPKIVAAHAELDAVKRQILDFEKTGGGIGPSMSDTPAAIMEYTNLAAELDLAAKIYSGLLTSLENLRLQAASEKLFVEVIDRAVAPERKSEPSRATICIIGTMAGGFISILLAFIMDAVNKLAADPEVRAKFAGGRKRRRAPSR